MTTILAGAAIVGLILGLLGSGGSAVLVPILVYVIGHETKTSIAESMVIVTVISAIGAIPFARSKCIDWQSVILFGPPAMAGTFLGAWLGGMASDAAQLSVFGFVLLVAAICMIKNAFGKKQPTDSQCAPREPIKLSLNKGLLIISEGMIVGIITGFVGVGGGFLIVPALLILGKLPIRTAIGTSLMIIAMKSAVGFIKYQQILSANEMSVDWTTVGIFIAIGLIGFAAGKRLNTRLNQRVLRQTFAVFLIVLGLFVLFKEGSQLF